MPDFETLVKDAIRNNDSSIEFVLDNKDCPSKSFLITLCSELLYSTGMIVEPYMYSSELIPGVTYVGFRIEHLGMIK